MNSLGFLALEALAAESPTGSTGNYGIQVWVILYSPSSRDLRVVVPARLTLVFSWVIRYDHTLCHGW